MAVTEALVLRARAVEKHYGHVHALRGADLEVRQREIHALLGDNGAGKSTLVKILSGVEHADSGRIELNGQETTLDSSTAARAAGIETVYQDLALALTLDAGENVFLGREIPARGFLGRLGFIDRKEMRRRAVEQLTELGVALRSQGAPVGALSGGQRQAVAIARAALWGHGIVILDEPTAALGAVQTQFVLDLIRRTRDEHGLSILWVSHNLPQVLEVADRVTVLHLGRTVLTAPARELTTDDLLRAITGAVSADPPKGAAD